MKNYRKFIMPTIIVVLAFVAGGLLISKERASAKHEVEVQNLKDEVHQKEVEKTISEEVLQREVDYYHELLKDYHESLPLAVPVAYNSINSEFGWRKHPIKGTVNFHEGIDLRADYGANVSVAGNGIIVEVGYSSGYGNYIMVNHGYDYKTLYAHLSKVFVEVGENVKRCDVIGKVGTSGHSTGPHLHYEIIKDDKKIDPSEYLFQINT